MKNTETGEFELVLGNRQLLSGFFVVVILFAVFFVMGYIVGRNSTPAPAAIARDQATPNLPAANPRPQTPVTSAPATPEPAPAAPASSPAQTDSEPSTGTRSSTEPTKKVSAPPVNDDSQSKNEASAPDASAGTYLQVTSVKQEVAEVVARTLKDKGFPSSLSPGPAGKTRVLVGPYPDLAALGKAKAELENLGFSPFVKK